VVAAICFSLQDAGVSGAGKKPRQEVHCRDGHSDAEKHAGKHTLRATFTEGESEPGHDNRNQGQPPRATKDSPRAIVLVNACRRTLTAFSQGDWPLTCANAAYARSETDFFRRAFFIAGEFLSDDASRAPHRDSKAMGRLAATSTFGTLRSPSRSTKSGERLPEPTRVRPIAGGRIANVVSKFRSALLSFSVTAGRRGIQRESPSNLTNGQETGKMFQRKMFHVLTVFFSPRSAFLARPRH
jgi:hypothetical protein